MLTTLFPSRPRRAWPFAVALAILLIAAPAVCGAAGQRVVVHLTSGASLRAYLVKLDERSLTVLRRGAERRFQLDAVARIDFASPRSMPQVAPIRAVDLDPHLVLDLSGHPMTGSVVGLEKKALKLRRRDGSLLTIPLRSIARVVFHVPTDAKEKP